MRRSALGIAALGIAALAAALLPAGVARAEDPDDAALRLADETPGLAEKASDWRSFAEGAAGGGRRRDGSVQDSRRLSLDIQYDHSFSPDWRAFVADRLDLGWPAGEGGQTSIHTLKEAYLSWRAQPDSLLDLGRVNVRNGVALGYNPTDFFRRNGLRSVVSISPASLKENRLGSVMVRGQRLWEGGSATALYSPKLADEANPYGLSIDLGATNSLNRWLIAVSQKLGGTLAPQFLAYGEEGAPPQFGVNLSGLVNDATTAHLEWSGGRGPTLLAQALGQAAPACACGTWHNRLATGLTYTTAHKVSLTAEYHYSGGALDKEGWEALGQGPLAAYGQYRNRVQAVQELPTRQALFVYGTWQDALIPRLDFSAMHNYDLADRSRRLWQEARYHVGQVEYALQWQRNSGRALSDFGAMPESRSWQAVLRHYF